MSRYFFPEDVITQKLVDFCNESSIFQKEFLSLFCNIPKKNVQNIGYTGNIDTGYGKPDITITFEDNSVYYIEVKTKSHTEFQKNQQKDGGYAELIKSKNQNIQDSFGYLLDKNHITIECITDVPVVRWNEVAEIIKDMGNTPLLIDIQQNVEGFVEELICFNLWEIYILCKTKEVYAAQQLFLKMNKIIETIDSDIINELSNYGFSASDYSDLCIGKYIRKSNDYVIYYGLKPELTIEHPECKSIFSVGIKKSHLPKNLGETEYYNYTNSDDNDCEWIFFPLDESLLFDEKNNIEQVKQAILKIIKSHIN